MRKFPGGRRDSGGFREAVKYLHFTHHRWLSVFRFTKASRNLGPLVLIFYQMIQRDLSRFIIIWSMLSVGFSAALYLQMQPPGAVELEKSTQLGADTTPEEEGGKFRSGIADWGHPWGAVLWIIRGNFGQSSFGERMLVGNGWRM